MPFNLSIYEAATIALSIVAVIVSIYTYIKTTYLQCYTDLNVLYMESLKLALDHPEFRDFEKTSRYKEAFTDKNQLLAYETYAYIVWNICETVYDKRRNDKTWYPIIDAEKKLHMAWFSNPENFHKFKKQFRNFIENEFETTLRKVESEL